MKKEEYDPLDIIDDCKEFIQSVESYESTARSNMKADLDCFYGDLWEGVAPGYREKMDRYARPVLEMKRMGPIVRRVVNDIINMEPGIKTQGRNTADKQKSENRQGVIRHILYNSNAQDAISRAVLHAGIMGRGHWRIATDWVEGQFYQEIKLDPIKNPLNVYLDPHRRTQDYSDIKCAAIVERMPKDEFEREYPEADPVNWEQSTIEGNWYDEESLLIAEYWEYKYVRKTLCQYVDGSIGYKDEIAKELKQDAKLSIVNEREEVVKELWWYKLTGKEVLDKRKIPGPIPIATVVAGEGEDSSGTLDIFGVVRDCKGSAWMYDLTSSLEAENFLQNSITPWTGDPRQFEGFETLYAESNSVPRAYLPHNTVIEEGMMVPAPSRVAPIPISPALLNAKMGYVNDMMASSGVNEARMGMQSNETSGRAILARSQESRATNSHIARSVNGAMTYTARILNKWMEVYMDTARVAKILDIELKPSSIDIEGPADLGDAYDDIIVTMGTGYLSNRMEAMESMMAFIQANPATAPLISDLIAENSDWPGSQKIAERLRSVMDPQVLEAGGGADAMAVKLRQAMSQLKQSSQMIEMLTQQLNQVQAELEDKDKELANKIELEAMKADSAREVALIRSETDLMKTGLSSRKDAP
jgi:hypothetical protein